MFNKIPSPMAYAMILTLVAFASGALYGSVGPFELLDAWAAGGKGFWSFLSFAMQMTLILLTGTVVAESPLCRRGLSVLATLPSSAAQATVMVSLVAMSTAWIHWGLGLIVGAVLTREVGRVANERGLAIHYPVLAAAGYSGLLVWHGGLSGSAPLKVTNMADLSDVLGPDLAKRVGTLPLEHTLLSWRNLLVTAALFIVIPLVLVWLLPRKEEDYQQPTLFTTTEEPSSQAGSALDHGPWLVLPFVALMAIWTARFVADGGLSRMGPNHLNFIFFGTGLVLAGSPAAYMRLAARGAQSATGILVQFPLYAGIRGLLVVSGLGTAIASLGSDYLLVSTFFSAGLLNLFVPSGGGQWGIQGPIALSVAMAENIEPARVVLAVAWGDQWTNAFQPFWALPLLGITGTGASDLLKNTAVVGVAVGIVLFLGVIVP